jgi:hypothetical protein
MQELSQTASHAALAFFRPKRTGRGGTITNLGSGLFGAGGIIGIILDGLEAQRSQGFVVQCREKERKEFEIGH